jgi:hypothetical protein
MAHMREEGRVDRAALTGTKPPESSLALGAANAVPVEKIVVVYSIVVPCSVLVTVSIEMNTMVSVAVVADALWVTVTDGRKGFCGGGEEGWGKDWTGFVPDTHGETFGFGLLMDIGMGVMEKNGRLLMIDSSYKVKLYGPEGMQVGMGKLRCLAVLPGSWVKRPEPAETVRFSCDW